MVAVPPRASSLWDATPGVTGARKRELTTRQAEAKQQAKQRRERVLKHEWACARLCRMFGYASATQWSGYVPPKADPMPDRGPQVARPNSSPQRAALIQLLRDVAHYDATGEMPREVLEATQLSLDAETK